MQTGETETNPQKLKALTEMPTQNQNRTPSISWMINYLGKFSTSTADTCESLRKLTPVKTE